MIRQELFCEGWEFSKNPLGTEYKELLRWDPVDIPHDWLIYDVNNLYETGTGWYRKHYYHELTEERIALRFEGVYMDSKVYVNGKQAGEWKYGYSTFELDITDLLRWGDNLITVRVDYQAPNSRWYSGAGIYRNVWLREYPHLHLVPDGIYVSADVSGELCISGEIADYRQQKEEKAYSIRMTVLAKGLPVEEKQFPIQISEGAFEETITVQNPVLWSLSNPYLYQCTVELLEEAQVVDTDTVSFGFRKAEFTCDHGFFLNGEPVKLHGACEHHDLGALGAATNPHAIRRKLKHLRQIGINAIRTSHNMPAVEWMDLADEMGFLVVSEAFDMWELPKTEYDYARFFPKWYKKDVAAWIRRDRNHPSLIAWSIGNEIYDTHVSERGQYITEALYREVRLHDPKNNAYVTIGSNYMEWDNAQKCADIVKLAGYNYAERLYEKHHALHPDYMIYGSETSSVIQSRGIYHFPYAQSVMADDDEQCSSLGNSATGWSAKNTEACIIPDRDAEYCAGQFIWTGFDYIGEPTPYNTKNSYFGQFDTAGFAKDSAYLFKGEWTDYKKDPFVHIFPYWDFSLGQPIDIRVASNAPMVELYFNGMKIAQKEIDHVKGTELTLNTILAYEPGELLAIAYDEDHKEIARDVQRSFKDTVGLCLTADKETMLADGEDLIFVTISAVDEEGNPVANANNRIEVRVGGAGRLVGLDNGDSTDYDPYKGRSRRLFSGKLLAIIAATDEPGELFLEASSIGLPTEYMILTSLPAEEVIRHPVTENQDLSPEVSCRYEDIPIRKIEFLVEKDTFTPECREMDIAYRVYPENARYREELEFRITTALGIASNLAEITRVEENRLHVVCHGDGDFYLRGLCKNGTGHYHILSVYPLHATGLGSAYFHPYEFVQGGLYDIVNEKAGNGIQRGAGFFGNGFGYFGYRNVDFGKWGSDTFTLPIFANCTTPVGLEVYDGIPEAGGRLLGEFTYHKPPQWMVYQKETFILPEVLRGVHDLVFASKDGYNVEGFCFEERSPIGTFIPADCAEQIYGDKYTVCEGEVLGIGNNVVLEFGTFDFTKEAPKAIRITGRSKLKTNSIHIIFRGDTSERILAEFEGSTEYVEREFPLTGITGVCQVDFVFLPGTEIDLRGFIFI